MRTHHQGALLLAAAAAAALAVVPAVNCFLLPPAAVPSSRHAPLARGPSVRQVRVCVAVCTYVLLSIRPCGRLSSTDTLHTPPLQPSTGPSSPLLLAAAAAAAAGEDADYPSDTGAEDDGSSSDSGSMGVGGPSEGVAAGSRCVCVCVCRKGRGREPGGSSRRTLYTIHTHSPNLLT